MNGQDGDWVGGTDHLQLMKRKLLRMMVNDVKMGEV